MPGIWRPLRIATGGGATLDSIASAAGDSARGQRRHDLNWLLPDLHRNVAGSLEAEENDLTNAIRYDAWGETIGTGSAPGGSTTVGAAALAAVSVGQVMGGRDDDLAGA